MAAICDARVGFYQGMGCEVVDQTPVSAALCSRRARENRYAFPLRMRHADEPKYSFGFICADVEGVSSSTNERGIDMIATPAGPAFVDPDNNVVTLFPAVP